MYVISFIALYAIRTDCYYQGTFRGFNSLLIKLYYTICCIVIFHFDFGRFVYVNNKDDLLLIDWKVFQSLNLEMRFTLFHVSSFSYVSDNPSPTPADHDRCTLLTLQEHG